MVPGLRQKKRSLTNSVPENGIRGLLTRSNHSSKAGSVSHNSLNAQEEIEASDTLISNEAIEDQTTEIPLVQSNDVNQVQSSISGIGSKKRGRGLTMGKGIMKMFATSGSKMKITVDPLIGRPMDADESAKLSSQIGVVTRDVLPVPIKWKIVDKEKDLNPCFDHLNIHMNVNIDDPGVKSCLVDRMQCSIRQKRYKLHKHFKNFDNVEEAKKNKPSFCANQKNWEELCDHFGSKKFKDISDMNSENRKKVRAPHISGRKPFTIRRNEISQKELQGQPCDRIELYKRTHKSDKYGWSTKEAEENWNLMIEKKKQCDQDGVVKTADEIVEEVLGRGSGYIKGLGYGPKPPSRCNASTNFVTQQLENELFETREKLQNSETKVDELTTEVTSLKEVISERGQY